MNKPGLKARLAAGESVIGSYVTIPSPEVVEIFGCAGMDFVILDMQHASPDWATLANMIRAADARCISAIVRVHAHDPQLILKVLELGPEGISLPATRNAGDVRKVVDAAYYPPVGRRSACGHTRAGGFNARRSEFPEHIGKQHARLLLWGLLEDAEAIAQAEDIAAVRPGLDVMSVGRGDLSSMLGHPGEIDHPEVIAAAERVIAAVDKASGRRCVSSVMIHKPEDIAPWRARGCRMFTYAADAILLMNAAHAAVAAFRNVVAPLRSPHLS